MSKLFIEVSGGVVTAVYGDDIPALHVVVRDMDNIDAGDPDPLPAQYTPEQHYA